MGQAIVVENLHKTYWVRREPGGLVRRRRRVEALRGLQLQVGRGEVLGILGHNGGGKTTLLEILATYLLPGAGSVQILGHDVVEEAHRVRQLVGYSPAGSRSFDLRMNGRQNLSFFASLANLSRREARERVEYLWKLTGMDSFQDIPVARYSDGMRQRLGLARALLLDPPVLLLDEPTQGLDPETAITWHRLLRNRLAREEGKAIVLVTHKLDLVQNACDRIVILSGGKTVEEGGARQILGTLRWGSLAGRRDPVPV